MKMKHIHIVLFGLYSALMLWLLFDRSGYETGIPYLDQLRWNLTPLKTIRLYCHAFRSGGVALRNLAIINLGGNVLMFIPLGFFLPRVFPKIKGLSALLLTTAAVIISVELIQLLTLLGSCDIDDLLLNLLGAAVGYWIHKSIQKNACSD